MLRNMFFDPKGAENRIYFAVGLFQKHDELVHLLVPGKRHATKAPGEIYGQTTE